MPHSSMSCSVSMSTLTSDASRYAIQTCRTESSIRARAAEQIAGADERCSFRFSSQLHHEAPHCPSMFSHALVAMALPLMSIDTVIILVCILGSFCRLHLPSGSYVSSRRGDGSRKGTGSTRRASSPLWICGLSFFSYR